MERKSYDFFVGLFVLAGLLALAFLALRAGNLTSSIGSGNTYELTARFDNIGQLKDKAPVKSAGVVVGRIKDIRFDTQTFQATVTLAMDARFQFPKDTTAKILTAGLLGEQYIGLEAGGDPDNLKAGERFARTQSALVLENLISQFLFSKAAEGPSTPAAGGSGGNGGDKK
ncbi:MAG TPA: outer membrane lipid asymmetry maintenance protein MlaD [Burkholderiaceae bacterium]|nr:outer membrane lipid asymmetry maintenance protein MlaD [Burkholderiaceae bacterium]